MVASKPLNVVSGCNSRNCVQIKGGDSLALCCTGKNTCYVFLFLLLFFFSIWAPYFKEVFEELELSSWGRQDSPVLKLSSEVMSLFESCCAIY